MKKDVFQNCPTYQSECFEIRKMEMKDAHGLFQCYSNPQAARYFNGDCCGDDFYYTDYEKFLECMKFWESSANSHFLRTAGPHFPDSPGHIKRTAWDISRAEGTPPH